MKYRTIVIDPPWPVDFIKMKRRPNKTEMPYKLMSIEEIEHFAINSFTADECDLFLWTTHTYLPYCFDIIRKWGFKYHCLITWDKTNGYSLCGFTRKTEFVVYAYKGKMGVNQRGSYIPTLFKSPQTKHSEKPSSFYELIRPNTQEPRIDIFSRKRHEGFQSWGDELESWIQTTILHN